MTYKFLICTQYIFGIVLQASSKQERLFSTFCSTYVYYEENWTVIRITDIDPLRRHNSFVSVFIKGM